MSSVKAVADRYIASDGGVPLTVLPIATTIAAIVAALPGSNGPPDPTPYEAVRDLVDDLYGEARNWADGEPIASQEVHDQVERLHDALHEAGKRANEVRIDEKKPLDDAVAEIQARYNLLIGDTKTAKGKVTRGKEALGALLAPWRTKVAAEKAAAAAAASAEAARLAEAAQAAIRASSGNLEAREQAEELLKDAKKVTALAKRETKAATTGTGLRSVWHADLKDEPAALDWAYARAPSRFTDLVQSIADEAVRGGLRDVPGFAVREEKVAR